MWNPKSTDMESGIHSVESGIQHSLGLPHMGQYLSNRKQYVALGDVKSSEQTMLCGIPQGSTLGPFLFLLYINDLPNCSEKLCFKIFADDTIVFASARDLRASAWESGAGLEMGVGRFRSKLAHMVTMKTYAMCPSFNFIALIWAEFQIIALWGSPEADF